MNRPRRLPDGREDLPPLFYYFARRRARRFHAQVTCALVECVQHMEKNRISLSLGQRAFRLWDFQTVWSVAKALLTRGYSAIRLVVLRHDNEDLVMNGVGRERGRERERESDRDNHSTNIDGRMISYCE